MGSIRRKNKRSKISCYCPFNNSKAAENGFMLLLWWCPLKISNRKMGRPTVHRYGLNVPAYCSLDTTENLLDNTFKDNGTMKDS
jgi:hypothetical protein